MRKHHTVPSAAVSRDGKEKDSLRCRAEDLEAGFPVFAGIVLVGIDFGIHLHFDKRRCFPSHGLGSSAGCGIETLEGLLFCGVYTTKLVKR
jgi:hypothetical protein